MAELKIGYARVSTVDQDLTAQREALAALGVDPKRIYVDHGLTGTNRDRPGLRQALAACRSGDTLVVTKLDRLARSVPDARDIVDELTAVDVKLNIGGSVHDPTDPVGRLLFTTLSMIAEFEADLARARTREGMAVRPSQRPAAWQAAQAQSASGGAPRRALPGRRAHHRRARGAVPGHPLDDLPGRRARGRARNRDLPTERSAMTDLVGRTTRGIFRDLMTDSTVGAITTAFQDEGFTPDPDCRYEDSSVRRRTTQSYLDTVDWTDPQEVRRFLRVAERLLNGWEPHSLNHFHQSLRRDGYQVDEQTGQITPVGPQLSIQSVARLADPSAIREGFERIRRAISDDPALAVGSAKELIESTAKVVLAERGQPFDDKSDLPKLARAAQVSLGLDPSTKSGPDSSDRVKRILGAVTTIANGLAELRNRGLGTGHGLATACIGLRSRHAHLAVNAAITWCQLMLDTPRRSRSAMAQRSVVSRRQAKTTKTTRFVPLLSRPHHLAQWNL
jgi:hypothetical protein